MKLHLPKALLTAVVAACTAFSVAQAADIGNSYATDYTYTNPVYTLGAAGGNTLSNSFYATSRADDNTSWNVSSDAATDGWAAILSNNKNTIRVDQSGTYKYEFNGLNIAGLIVEAGIDGASIQSMGSGGTRSIEIGAADTEYDSYFASSFTLQNTTALAGTTFSLQGTQNWHIADGKTVTLKSYGDVVNNGTWAVNGGTIALTKGLTNNGTWDVSACEVNISSTINNSSGTIKTGSNTVFNISQLDNLEHQFSADWSNTLTENGTITLSGTYTLINGGTIEGSGATVKYTADGTERTQTLSSDPFTQDLQAYGVATDTTLADIVDSVNTAGSSLIAIKEGATLSRGDGASFTTDQKLNGSGKYDRGVITANSSADVKLLIWTYLIGHDIINPCPQKATTSTSKLYQLKREKHTRFRWPACAAKD